MTYVAITRGDDDIPIDDDDFPVTNEAFDEHVLEDSKGDIEETTPSVSSPPVRTIATVMTFAFFAIIALYFFIFSGDDEKPEAPPPVLTQAIAPDTNIPSPPLAIQQKEEADAPLPPPIINNTSSPLVIDIIPAPKQMAVPVLPPLINTQPRAAIPKPAIPQKPNQPSAPQAQAPAPVKPKQWNTGSMFLINGGNLTPNNDPDIYFPRRQAAANDETAEASVSALGNTDYLIAQGKMIHVTLETAINTDLPGTLRAIVNRDIYAESGRNILISKGSRVIGQYGSGIVRGQRRLLITWNRILRPDGLDIKVDSQGTDLLGRYGVGGEVDQKYFEIITNAVLLSSITLIASQALSTARSQQTQTLDNEGNTTTSNNESAADRSARQAVDSLSGAANEIVQGVLQSGPTMMIDQGTRINIFVNQDIQFPDNITQ